MQDVTSSLMIQGLTTELETCEDYLFNSFLFVHMYFDAGGKRENEILLELSSVLSRMPERQTDLKCELLHLLN